MFHYISFSLSRPFCWPWVCKLSKKNFDFNFTIWKFKSSLTFILPEVILLMVQKSQTSTLNLWNPINNGIYQLPTSTGDRRISEPSTVFPGSFASHRKKTTSFMSQKLKLTQIYPGSTDRPLAPSKTSISIVWNLGWFFSIIPRVWAPRSERSKLWSAQPWWLSGVLRTLKMQLGMFENDRFLYNHIRSFATINLIFIFML